MERIKARQTLELPDEVALVLLALLLKSPNGDGTFTEDAARLGDLAELYASEGVRPVIIVEPARAGRSAKLRVDFLQAEQVAPRWSPTAEDAAILRRARILP